MNPLPALLCCCSLALAADPVVPGDAASLQTAVTAAIAAGDALLTVPPGTYRFAEPPAGRPHLLIEKAAGLTIAGDGATLVFAGRDRAALSLRGCRDLTLRGLRLERATPSAAQGRIERLEEDGRFCVVRLDPGYPQDVADRRFYPVFWTSLFTADGSRWLAHYRGITPPEIQVLEPGLIRVRMNDRPASLPVAPAPGMPLAWRGAVADDIEIRDCEDCLLDGITVAGGAGMCFHERGGGGNRYVGCRVVRAARPPGATAEPLLSSSADGFHSSGARRGPHLERCLFEHADDDSIAIHGSYAMVLEARGTTLIVWRFRAEENALYGAPGDHLRVYDPRGACAGEAVMTAVRRLDGYQVERSPDPKFAAFADPARAVVLEVACDRPLACEPGWLLSDPASAGSGYVVRDCIIRDGCARGILAKGDHGLIQGNLIERMARAAIEFNPEMERWSENDYARDVMVRGNTIRQVARNRQNGDLRHPGAIVLLGFRRGVYVPAPGGHRDITILGNLFEDIDGPNLLIASSIGVRVEGNTFLRPMHEPSNFGSSKGVDPAALVWGTHSSQVAFVGNRIEAPGPGMQRLIAAGPGWDAPIPGDGLSVRPGDAP